MKRKKHLSFDSLRQSLSTLLEGMPDKRQESKRGYSIHDTLMSGFACMFFQDQSLLQFQQRLKEEKDRDNLATLFGVNEIPEQTQMREIIDEIDSEQFRPIFKEYFSNLQRGKHLKEYQLFPGLYLCSIDGSGYFSSQKIHCESCLTKRERDGNITYSHKVLQGALMHPNKHQVIPLMPEEIKNRDGASKQDCETKAAKRLIAKIRKDHPQLGIIIVGDDLFSTEPFIRALLDERMHCILVAKPSDHSFMINWIETYGELNQMTISDEKGRLHLYSWINNVPLNGNNTPIKVNYFHYQIIVNEKVTYKNSWVTDLEITKKNVPTLVRGGRCRWKIENECFNTLKNQGYHLEHNFGHGAKNLCFNFLLLTLLAFFFHQIFELTDQLFQDCRRSFGSKLNLWQSLRSYIKILIFDSWYHLLDFALTPSKYNLALKPP